jgi:hypothetical protein
MQQHRGTHMEQILLLLQQLRRPHRFTSPAPPPLPEPMSDQEWQGVVKGVEADESSLRDPEIPVAQGNDRDPLREQLWRLAAKELRLATEQWQKTIAAQEAPLSARSRDLLAIEVSPELELMRREERSCFREFARLIRDLMKLQKEPEVRRAKSEGKPQGESEVQGPKSEGADHHPRPPVQESSTGDAAEGGAISTPPTATALQAQNTDAEDGTEKNVRKNEGASGYVEENTGSLESDGTRCPSTVSQPKSEVRLSPDDLTEPKAVPPAVTLTGLLPSGSRTAA